MNEKTIQIVGISAIAVTSIAAAIVITTQARLQPTANTDNHITIIGERVQEVQEENNDEDEKNGQQLATRSAPAGIPSTRTYQEEIENYEGRRIQFTNCQATPSAITFKNGTQIMLDGKSEDPQRILINNRAIILYGYDVAYVTLRSNEAPITVSVDCEWLGSTQYNIAELLLQP